MTNCQVIDCKLRRVVNVHGSERTGHGSMPGKDYRTNKKRSWSDISKWLSHLEEYNIDDGTDVPKFRDQSRAVLPILLKDISPLRDSLSWTSSFFPHQRVAISYRFLRDFFSCMVCSGLISHNPQTRLLSQKRAHTRARTRAHVHLPLMRQTSLDLSDDCQFCSATLSSRAQLR